MRSGRRSRRGSLTRWRPFRPASILAYVREQIRVLTALDPGVRRDRPDSAHRMRVACRRLRSCLRLYRSVLDREVTDAIRGDLKWLAGELCAERDQAVLMKRLTRGVKALPKELVLGPVSARLQAWNVARGSESHQRSLDAWARAATWPCSLPSPRSGSSHRCALWPARRRTRSWPRQSSRSSTAWPSAWPPLWTCHRGADYPGPFGLPWREGKRPYGHSALKTVAACLKGFYLHLGTR
ncbi:MULTISPECIES: CHAD domain-containing protein [unclassified Streptomyces]|uniref:CHAD domain-containing protein n=1 Tax=unclassified Streptomyces TaxID=2593676 RepID=UPI0033D1687D